MSAVPSSRGPGRPDDREGSTPLYKAAIQNDLDVIKRCIDRGESVESGGPGGLTPLMGACEAGCIEAGQYLLQLNANPSASTNAKWTALHYCAISDCQTLASTLIAMDPLLLHSRTIEGETALLLACIYGAPRLLRALLAAGADANVVSQSGYNPVLASVEYQHLHLLDYLFQYKAIVPFSLCAAAANGRPDLLEYIIRGCVSLRSDPNQRTPAGLTLLHLAVVGQQERSIHSLLQLPGIDLEAMDKNLGTPLHSAIEMNQQSIAFLLLEAGASPATRHPHPSHHNCTALQMALEKCPELMEVAYRILRSRPHIFVEPLMDRVALALAGNVEAFRLLASENFSLQPSNSTESLIFTAARAPAAKRLLFLQFLATCHEFRFISSVRNSLGQTLLMVAAATKLTDVFDWILTKTPLAAALRRRQQRRDSRNRQGSSSSRRNQVTPGSELEDDVDAQDPKGNTALHYAVLSADRHMVAALLQHGASMEIANNSGVTPLELAQKDTHAEDHIMDEMREFVSTHCSEGMTCLFLRLKI